jgi:hypothetical protein
MNQASCLLRALFHMPMVFQTPSQRARRTANGMVGLDTAAVSLSRVPPSAYCSSTSMETPSGTAVVLIRYAMRLTQ